MLFRLESRAGEARHKPFAQVALVFSLLHEPSEVIVKRLRVRSIGCQQNFDEGCREVGDGVNDLFLAALTDHLDSGRKKIIVLKLFLVRLKQLRPSRAQPSAASVHEDFGFIWKERV